MAKFFSIADENAPRHNVARPQCGCGKRGHKSPSKVERGFGLTPYQVEQQRIRRANHE